MEILIQLCTVFMIGIAVMSLPHSASNGEFIIHPHYSWYRLNYSKINVLHLALDEVRQHPKSKLVAVGVEVTFHCQLVDRLHSYWVVGDTPGIQAYLDRLQNRGFFIGRSSQNGITTLSLRVTATMDKNRTEIFCSSTDGVRTDKAVLLVIQGKFCLIKVIFVDSYNHNA